MPKFYEYKTHSDRRREGCYDIIPGLEGSFNFTKHPAGIIPAELHMHKNQTDYFTVAKGKVMFRLVYEDGRAEEKFIISENDNRTLIISPGTWHNYMALEPSVMVFYVSHKYDESDEFRKKTNASGWTFK